MRRISSIEPDSQMPIELDAEGPGVAECDDTNSQSGLRLDFTRAAHEPVGPSGSIPAVIVLSIAG